MYFLKHNTIYSNSHDLKKKCIKLNKNQKQNIQYLTKYKAKSKTKHIEIINKFHKIISKLTGRKFIADSHEKRQMEEYYYNKFKLLQLIIACVSIISMISCVLYYELTLNLIDKHTQKFIELLNILNLAFIQSSKSGINISNRKLDDINTNDRRSILEDNIDDEYHYYEQTINDYYNHELINNTVYFDFVNDIDETSSHNDFIDLTHSFNNFKQKSRKLNNINKLNIIPYKQYSLRNLHLNFTYIHKNKYEGSIYYSVKNSLKQKIFVNSTVYTDYYLNEHTQFNKTYIVFLYISTFSTLIIIMMKWFYQLILLKYLKYLDRVSSKSTLFSTDLYKDCIYHTLFLLIHPSPLFSETTYSSYNDIYKLSLKRNINSLLTGFVLLRIIYLITYFLFSNKFSNQASNEICRTFFFETNRLFSWKALMKESPIIILSLVGIYLIYFFTFFIRLFERGYNPNTFNNFLNPIWFILVTMTTVGYGDIVPKTNEGKVIATIGCMFGVFTISFLIITITSFCTMNFHDINSFLIIEKTKMNEKRNKKAERVVYCFCVFYYKRKKYYNSRKLRSSLQNKNSKNSKNIRNDNMINNTYSLKFTIKENEGDSFEVKNIYYLFSDLYNAIKQFQSHEEVVDGISFENYKMTTINKNLNYFKKEYEGILKRKNEVKKVSDQLIKEVDELLEEEGEV